MSERRTDEEMAREWLTTCPAEYAIKVKSLASAFASLRAEVRAEVVEECRNAQCDPCAQGWPMNEVGSTHRNYHVAPGGALVNCGAIGVRSLSTPGSRP